MPDAARCPQCDALLPADSVEGLCPKCLLRLAMPTEPIAAETMPFAAGTEATEDHEFGAYKIVRILGEGGMGTVYLAEQREPIRRLVALKVIKLGMSTREVMARFDSERQALALMDHPNIARVFDAGASDRGRPYFVMEYVDGVPITEYCDRHRLNNRERIELFIAVCQAVHHAHQKGIIHRDIKPSNVLVSEQDGKPFPKVIDFGIAKAIDQRAIEQATFTQMGSLVGTPEYMSPEQTLLTANIDTTTDVYSLGVLLYELLAGALPFEGKRLREAGLEELLRIIREEDPPTPSDKVSKLPDTAQVAERRRTNPALLRRQLTGDLNWIVMKALEKERLRRYASVSELAADIRRHLENHVVLAGPPSKLYRARKFVQRHRLAVSAGVLIAASLIVGAAVATVERNRAVAEKQRADTEAATARAVNDFLQNDLLAQASASTQARPGTRPDPDLKVRTALDRAAARIEGKFQSKPLVEASIRQTIGKTYADLGLYPDAQRQLERALDLRRRVLGQEHPNTLETMESLGVLYHHQGKNSQAEPLFTNVLGIRRRLLGEEHPDTLETMDDLSSVYHDNGNLTKAEPLLTKVLSARRRVLGSEHPNTLITMNDLAYLYRDQGKFAQAEALFTDALEVKRRVLGEEHPSTLMAMNNLAVLYSYQGKYAEAEPLLTKVFEVRGRVLGEEHHDTLITMNDLSGLYYYLGKYPQAELLITRGLDMERRILGTEHPDVLTSMNNLAGLYRDEGKYVQAEALYNRVVTVERRVLGEEHPNTLNSLSGLALLYRNQGKYAQSELLYVKVLDVQRRVLGAEHIRRLMGMNDLSLLYLYQGKYTQAEPLLREALNSFQKIRNDTWIRYSTQSLLGASLAGQRKYEEAEPLAVSGFEGMLHRETTIPAASRFKLEQAGAWIVQLYQDWGKPENAAVWTQKLKDAGLSVSPKKKP